MTDFGLVSFTDDDIAVGPVLGPEYRASNRLAEAMLVKFEAEHLKPLVEKVADEFRDKLWDDVRDWLLTDTELNVGGAVRDMVEQTITALLTGKEWAMQRYPYADYSKGEEIRKAVAVHCGDTLASRRVAELEAEVAKHDETIRMMRESRW
jgi:hypothetical protein